MPPKKDKEKEIQAVNMKAALKPGGVSVAPDWAVESGSKNDAGFTVVGKKNRKSGQQQQQQPQPQQQKQQQKQQQQQQQQQPMKPPAPAPKPKPQPKFKPPPAAPVVEEKEEKWQTVPAKSQKPKQQQQPHQKQQQQQQQRQNFPKPKEQKPLTEAEKKKEEKEAKRREKELQKLRLQQNASHVDPAGGGGGDDDGFVTVTKGAKVKGKAAPLESFGASTAFTKLQKNGPVHKKVPKAREERTVAEVSQEELQAKIRAQFEKLTARPEAANVRLMVRVQGKWHSAESLLEANNFEHAQKFVQATVREDSLAGGIFIEMADSKKHWADEHTVDELWMCTEYLKNLTKLLETEKPVTLTPYWPSGKGEDATVSVEINRPTLQKDCYPTMKVKHEQRHPTALQEINPSIHQFVRDLIREAGRLSEFVHKVDLACDALADHKKFKDGEGKKRLAAYKAKLPTKVDDLKTNLEWAFKEFCEKYPEPSSG